ncbi:MAG: macro domain-containing protein [Gudongella sp.]|nr:macro domain-containing protein [Gudongella sp.]
MKLGKAHINIKKGDITEERVDGIVNAANNTLLGGGGVDGAIHRKGGPSILEQCKKHSGCPTGEARITTAGNLPCKYVIHAVGPVYGRSDGMAEELLYNVYMNSMKLADEYGLNSLSFPSISTGAYGYPIQDAVNVVWRALEDFSRLDSTLKEINLVLFSEEDLKVYEDYFNQSIGEA